MRRREEEEGGAVNAPASTGKATVGPALNEFKAEARYSSGVPLVPIDVGAVSDRAGLVPPPPNPRVQAVYKRWAHNKQFVSCVACNDRENNRREA